MTEASLSPKLFWPFFQEIMEGGLVQAEEHTVPGIGPWPGRNQAHTAGED